MADTKSDDSDWVEKFDEKKQRPYWRNKKTKEATWKNPFKNTDASTKEGNEKRQKTDEEGTEQGHVDGRGGRKDEEGEKRENEESNNQWSQKFDAKKGRNYWKNETTGEIVWRDPGKDTHDHHHSGADPTLAASIAAAAMGMGKSVCYPFTLRNSWIVTTTVLTFLMLC